MLYAPLFQHIKCVQGVGGLFVMAWNCTDYFCLLLVMTRRGLWGTVLKERAH
jgi:hypothetical protein